MHRLTTVIALRRVFRAAAEMISGGPDLHTHRGAPMQGSVRNWAERRSMLHVAYPYGPGVPFAGPAHLYLHNEIEETS